MGCRENEGVMQLSKIRRFTLYALPRDWLKIYSFDNSPKTRALISCVLVKDERVKAEFGACLELPFMDVVDPNYPNAFCSAHAQKILDFVQELPPSVTDLYVCCNRGQSRSPAVAAALLRLSGRSDAAVWKNPFYYPNPLVYRCLCKTAGMNAMCIGVRWRVFRNKRVFRRASQRGVPEQYEQGQPLG